ncbi:MAG: universal stress protein [Nevskia sp.]|nr:universal stress protein [Nevskia sp.]
MSALTSIMVVMSERRATPALHRAEAYARRSGAALHLCLFDYYAPIDYAKGIFGREVADRARRDFIDERMRWLAEQAKGLASQGLEVDCDVIWAAGGYKAVIGKILELKPGLVIKDIACDPYVAATLHPSGSDWKLIRLSPFRLMLVHPKSKVLPQRVLAAVDVSVAGEARGLNVRVLEAARNCAELSGAEADVASVFSYVPAAVEGTDLIADAYERMNAAHQEALEKFAAANHIDAGHVLRRNAFDAAEGIALCAQECGADLVVLGSAYHSGLDRLMFGTTAEALLRKLACDVLLIKPAGFLDELARHVELPQLKEAKEEKE